MSEVMLVAGDVPAACVAAFKTKLRWNRHVDPLIALAPSKYASLRDTSLDGMTRFELEQAADDESFVIEAMEAMGQKLASRILPWGSTSGDVKYVIWGAEVEHRYGFDWLLTDDEDVMHCFVRIGDNGEAWLECLELGNFDATEPLGNLRGDTVYDITDTFV
jgi:hypothetical protein